MTVEYSSNNSGGSWWLSDEDWKNLEDAGWRVDWFKDNPHYSERGGRFLGALAYRAERDGLPLGDAIEEWESITGKDPESSGCDCCGSPHYFEVID